MPKEIKTEIKCSEEQSAKEDIKIMVKKGVFEKIREEM